MHTRYLIIGFQVNDKKVNKIAWSTIFCPIFPWCFKNAVLVAASFKLFFQNTSPRGSLLNYFLHVHCDWLFTELHIHYSLWTIEQFSEVGMSEIIMPILQRRKWISVGEIIFFQVTQLKSEKAKTWT